MESKRWQIQHSGTSFSNSIPSRGKSGRVQSDGESRMRLCLGEFDFATTSNLRLVSQEAEFSARGRDGPQDPRLLSTSSPVCGLRFLSPFCSFKLDAGGQANGENGPTPVMCSQCLRLPRGRSFDHCSSMLLHGMLPIGWCRGVPGSSMRPLSVTYAQQHANPCAMHCSGSTSKPAISLP